MKKVCLLTSMVLGSLLILPLRVWSQTQNPNLDFSSGTLTNWQCYAGSCLGGNYSIDTSSPLAGRHTIMDAAALNASGQLYDEYCDKIPKVPYGYNYSCRIGNSNAGSEVDAIEYELTVDSSNSLLLLSFAWVIEYSGHDIRNQPDFTVKILDSGRRVWSYGNPLVLSGFPECDAVPYTRSWTTIGYDLRTFIGQKVYVYFETRDCTLGDHFGYAYVLAACRPMQIDIWYCVEQLAHVKAPDGFENYIWTRSSDTNWRAFTPQINILNPHEGEIITCVLRSELGCEYELKTVIEKTSIDADFMYGVKDEDGHVDFAGHDSLSWYDTCNRTATFVDLSTIKNDTKASILWEVIDTMTGNTIAVSSDSLFTYTFPDIETDQAVEYKVRLTVLSKSGCENFKEQYIIIYPSFLRSSINANFSTQQKIYCNKTNIVFTNRTSVLPYNNFDCDINIVCEWDWGDGTNSRQTFMNSPADPYPIMEHQYNFQAKKTEVVVTLRVKADNSNYEAIFTDTLTIIRPAIADFTDDGHIFPCPGKNGRTISFADASDGEIVYYIWDFGDSAIEEGLEMTNPVHTYTIAGSYTVTLVVQSSDGCMDTMRKDKHVFIDGPVGTISYTPLSGCIPFEVTFTPQAYDPVNKIYTADSVIYFPDSATFKVRFGMQVNNPETHFYINPGQYVPHFQLIKWVDNNGTKERCVVEWSGVDPILIIDLKPDFISDSLYGLDVPIEFENTTVVNPALLADSIHWDYGNNYAHWIYNTNTESHNGFTTYDTEKTYRVTLTEYYKLCNQSKSYDIEVREVVGIANRGNANTDISILPNPASTKLYVKHFSQETTDFTVFSITGQIIMQGKLQNNSILNIEPLAKGMYYLRILEKVMKFVKQ